MIHLENKVDIIADNQVEYVKALEAINKKHNNTMIQMRDLLTKLIKGR